jgi:5'-nucleotidase
LTKEWPDFIVSILERGWWILSMHILLTNDDGIYAPGLRALYEGLNSDNKVTVIAPESEQSAVGHAITILKPLRIKTVSLSDGFKGFAVDGTPADCVKIGIRKVLNHAPDFIVSGINPGANVGVNALYSGTVSAATEGAILGIPSIAVSVDSFTPHSFEPAVRLARSLIQIIKQRGLKKGTALNVNIPGLPWEEIKGITITRHSASRFEETFDQRVDPRGNIYYWHAAETLLVDANGTTDQQALLEGKISITPIHCDLTDYDTLEHIKKWPIHMETM